MKKERKAINIKWSSVSGTWELYEWDNEQQEFVYSGAYGVIGRNDRDYVCDDILENIRDWTNCGYTVKIL